MPLRTWLFSVIFGLAVISALAYFSWTSFSRYQDDHAAKRDEIAQYEADAAERGEELCGAVLSEEGFFRWLACVVEGVTADSSAKQAEYDLKAQQDMAEWAFGMLIVTIWIAVTTFVGVVFVGWTLKVTRQMAVDTREMSQSQSRAYVDVGSVRLYWGTPGGEHPEFKVSIFNWGNTPAKWFQIRQGYTLVPIQNGMNLPKTFDELSLPKEFGPIWNGINPSPDGMSFDGPIVESVEELKKCWRDPPSAIKHVPDNTHGVLVFGEIKYCTIFDEIYVSQFYFGAGSLNSFEVEDIVEHKRLANIHDNEISETVFEKPQDLIRLSIKLDLYKADS